MACRGQINNRWSIWTTAWIWMSMERRLTTMMKRIIQGMLTSLHNSSINSNWHLHNGKHKLKPKHMARELIQVKASLTQLVYRVEQLDLTALSSWRKSWTMIITQRTKKLKNMQDSWEWTSVKTRLFFTSLKKVWKHHCQVLGSHAKVQNKLCTTSTSSPRSFRKSILAMTITGSSISRRDRVERRRSKKRWLKSK